MTTLAAGKTGHSLAKEELRARQPFSYPVDPLYVTTMSDYDLSLQLFRTWFNYDDGRVAQPDLITSWRFDEKTGAYEFTISQSAKWSDGTPLRPIDLQKNLSRAIENDSTYGHGIKEIMDVSSFTATSEHSFRIRTKDGKPNEAFFQRLGSIFLAVSSPVDFPQGPGRLVSNKVSLGPYHITHASETELELQQNPHFQGLNPKSPKVIRIRKPDPNFSLMDFLEGKTWENYVQTNTIIPPAAAKKLLSSGLPYWTRGYDRVTVLKPLGKGHALEKRREVLKALAWQFQNFDIQKSDLNLRRADSLQPFGYPLSQKISFPKPSVPVKAGTIISVLAPANYYGEFHREHILRAAAQLGVKVDWKAVEVTQFYREFSTAHDTDFLLINFGVADPEPTTWMGLLFSENNFISFEEQDRVEFQKISASKSKEAEVAAYKKLLERIALRGGFLPLFHFSTLSIGQRNMNFKAIRELDETVNFSKVILE